MSLSHLYWLGGSPCGGKSSVAEILSAKYDIKYFKIDDYIEHCLQEATPDKYPFLHQWKISTWDERWMLPGETLLENVIGCYREEFDLLYPQILNLPKQPTIIEGNPVFPDICKHLGISSSKALWLIATPNFLRTKYAQRTWVPQVLAECSDPTKAFNHWIERDIQFADWIRHECQKLNYTDFETSGQQTLEQRAASIARIFHFV